MITLIKNFINENKTQKKINIRKIVSMKEVIEKPINEVRLKIQSHNDIEKIDKLNLENGKTKIIIDLEIENKTLSFQFRKNRKIDHKMLNLLRNDENIEII